MNKVSSNGRFSKRVENYLISRPSYPEELYAFIQKTTTIYGKSTIVNIGAGTGILSQLFLNQGYKIWAIELNKEMRLAAEKLFSTNEKFISHSGIAENIPLPNAFADLIVAGQAFHWFDSVDFQRECRRVLKSGGKVALLWNEWDAELCLFLMDYEALLQDYGTDYNQVTHQNKNVQTNIQLFFVGQKTVRKIIRNEQIFSYSGLKSRLLSSSYVPLETNPNFRKMINRLKWIFKKHHENEKVRFDYKTQLYLGTVQ